jgi:hypothetical protein
VSFADRVLGLAWPSAAEVETEDVDLPPSDALDLIANERRRLLLHAAVEADRDGEPVDLASIARGIAAAENDCPPGEIDCQQRKRSYVGCYQTHLPHLVDAGAVTYVDESKSCFRATDLGHALDELARDAENRCSEGDAAYQPHDFESVREQVLADGGETA